MATGFQFAGGAIVVQSGNAHGLSGDAHGWSWRAPRERGTLKRVKEGGPLGVRLDSRGVCLQALDLWLDPFEPTPLAFVSHAHAASALASERVLASPETLRLGRASGGDALGWEDSLEMALRPEFGGGTARLRLARAGHMLGAAQLVVDHAGGRLVYTGDWSSEGDGTTPPGACVRCDELILNTTFALPLFRFEPIARVLARLVDWCSEHLARGVTPVLIASSPGTAQVAGRALTERGLPVTAHEEVARACTVYEALGIPVGIRSKEETTAGGRSKEETATGVRSKEETATGVRSKEETAAGGRPKEQTAAGVRSKENAAVVLAPARSRAPAVRPSGRSVVAYVSGWALLDAAVEQKRADAAFAMALTADHDGLLGLVRETEARHVYTTRGDANVFAHILAQHGVRATPLDVGPIDDRSVA